jgi:NTE family protein
MALPAIFVPVMREGRLLMDGGLVNPLPFDLVRGEADITVAIDVSGASTGPGKHPLPSAFSALMSSSQILQRSIVREKLKAQQPDIYIDVEVDKFFVLDFHRFGRIIEAASAAQEQLRRQLKRVLASHTLETLPAVVAEAPPPGPKRKGRRGTGALKRLTRRGKP